MTAACAPARVTAPLEPVWLRVDGYAIMQCLLFLVDQLRQWCRAEDFSLTLEQRRSLAKKIGLGRKPKTVETAPIPKAKKTPTTRRPRKKPAEAEQSA